MHLFNVNHKTYLFGIALALLCAGACVFYSCEKESTEENPYDDVDYSTGTGSETPLDPNSIQGLHKNIFSVRCAIPACHDGSFEPDYRTVQSTYSTLVYQPVIKNDSMGTFKYRVVPYDVNKSWLHERLITGDSTLGQMPLYNTPLSQAQMDQIKAWINNGAPDQDGNIAQLPNQLPTVVGYVAFNAAFVRIDTIRYQGIPYNPFMAPVNETISIYFVVSDDSTKEEDMLLNQLKISTDANNFSSATVINATFVNLFGFKVWQANVNTALFPQATTLFFRYYINDGDHAINTEYPNDQTMFLFKSVYSLRIE